MNACQAGPDSTLRPRWDKGTVALGRNATSYGHSEVVQSHVWNRCRSQTPQSTGYVHPQSSLVQAWGAGAPSPRPGTLAQLCAAQGACHQAVEDVAAQAPGLAATAPQILPHERWHLCREPARVPVVHSDTSTQVAHLWLRCWHGKWLGTLSMACTSKPRGQGERQLLVLAGAGAEAAAAGGGPGDPGRCGLQCK